MSDIQFSF